MKTQVKIDLLRKLWAISVKIWGTNWTGFIRRRPGLIRQRTGLIRQRIKSVCWRIRPGHKRIKPVHLVLMFFFSQLLAFRQQREFYHQNQGDTLLQRTTIFPTYLLLSLNKAVLLSLTTFPFILNILTSLRIAFIQKVETF